jgi:hypothetical protein
MSKKLQFRPEEGLVVFGFLARFARAYPSMAEHEQRWYQDLCRGAIPACESEEAADERLLHGEVDAIIWRAAKEDVGVLVLKYLCRQGLAVEILQGEVYLAPQEKVEDKHLRICKRFPEGIRKALAGEVIDQAARTADESPLDTE